MPYHSNSVDKMKEKIDKKKEEKERKPRKKTQKELFDKKKVDTKKELTKAQMDQLKKHSKLHKGGMNSFHMKNMIKFMKQGNSFMKAHMKAQQLDKAKM
tara:strand:- start:140 stop:436 length:297 start_codon:yes stop_codon:yes gene_type:complete